MANGWQKNPENSGKDKVHRPDRYLLQKKVGGVQYTTLWLNLSNPFNGCGQLNRGVKHQPQKYLPLGYTYHDKSVNHILYNSLKAVKGVCIRSFLSVLTGRLCHIGCD